MLALYYLGNYFFLLHSIYDIAWLGFWFVLPYWTLRLIYFVRCFLLTENMVLELIYKEYIRKLEKTLETSKNKKWAKSVPFNQVTNVLGWSKSSWSFVKIHLNGEFLSLKKKKSLRNIALIQRCKPDWEQLYSILFIYIYEPMWFMCMIHFDLFSKLCSYFR